MPDLTEQSAAETIARLSAELLEQTELNRIVQDGWDACNQRNENTLVLLRAEKLLRDAAENDNEKLRMRLDALDVQLSAVETDLGRVVRAMSLLEGPLSIIWQEVLSMLNIKDRVRRAVYACFPEIDPEAGARSWVSNALDQLSFLRSDLTSVWSVVQTLSKQQRRGTVVLLAPEGFKGPRFLSQTVTLGEPRTTQTFHYGSSGTEMTVPFETLHWPLPPGGWIVAHGCRLSDVFVANKAQATTPGAEYCQLSDEVALGVRLQVRVRFE